MKIILNLLKILSLVLIPFSPFSQEVSTNTLIASVEYLEQELPVEKKVRLKKSKVRKKKKHRRKYLRHQLKQQKKQENNNKKGLPIYFFIIAGVLLIGLIAWLAYFLPLLISGGLATGGCLAPLIAFMLGFLGIFFGLILLAGIVIFTIFAILIIYRNNSAKTRNSTGSKNNNHPAEDDFVKIQIQDKASKDFPNLAPETLEKYVNIKDSIVELKYERSKLDATEAKGRMKARIQGKIAHINNRITEKETIIDAIEKSYDDLEQLPEHKRLPYIDIKIKLAKLRSKQKKYQRENDLRSIARLRAIENAIKEQEEELKLLLGIHKD